MESDDIDSDFRHIQLDDTGPFRSLQVDKLFLRAHQWRSQNHGEAESSTAQSREHRPPSPVRKRQVYPLPLPNKSAESPLGGLFDYPEITPLVLSHFDHPRDFVNLARVCKSWTWIVRKRLYEHIWVRPCMSSASCTRCISDLFRGEREPFQDGFAIPNPPPQTRALWIDQEAGLVSPSASCRSPDIVQISGSSHLQLGEARGLIWTTKSGQPSTT